LRSAALLWKSTAPGEWFGALGVGAILLGVLILKAYFGCLIQAVKLFRAAPVGTLRGLAVEQKDRGRRVTSSRDGTRTPDCSSPGRRPSPWGGPPHLPK
jgi:hypothetical protein